MTVSNDEIKRFAKTTDAEFNRVDWRYFWLSFIVSFLVSTLVFVWLYKDTKISDLQEMLINEKIAHKQTRWRALCDLSKEERTPCKEVQNDFATFKRWYIERGLPID